VALPQEEIRNTLLCPTKGRKSPKMGGSVIPGLTEMIPIEITGHLFTILFNHFLSGCGVWRNVWFVTDTEQGLF